MALHPEEIHVGPAHIFIDVDAPATSPDVDSEPEWLAHSNGVPSSGTEVGATLGDAVITWTSTKIDIVAEQVMGILDKFISDQMMTVAFEAEERTYQLLKNTFDNINSVNNSQRMGFWGGGGGTTINIIYTTIALTSLRRDIAGAYEVFCAYKCVSMNPMPITYSRTKPSTYAVQFQCLPDTTRTEGDQIFQLSREKQADTFGSASTSGSTSGSKSPSASVSKSPSSSVSPS